MSFPFSYVCDLLQQVADLRPGRGDTKPVVNDLIHAWFDRHRSSVVEAGPALLSALLPDQRTDRVYGLQAPSLQRIVVRGLGLGHSRAAELGRWTRPGLGGVAVDLGDCVEGILRETPNTLDPSAPVSVQEIDAVLLGVAAQCRFSAPAVREAGAATTTTCPNLAALYQRLSPRDAKWLTRLVLKDYRPVVLDAHVVQVAFHPRLPLALRVLCDFDTAVASLRTGPAAWTPRLGVKVGRQFWAKGRSIQHCIAMGRAGRSHGPRLVSCERKMDGEYVQVHIDFDKGASGCIQLFSKSGKDSTRDRAKLHGCIRDSLRLDAPDCPLTRGCILEGEMVAYDERQGRILAFDAIRKHVTRGGAPLYAAGTAGDAPYEHLMIVYYDLLLVDGTSLLGVPHAERFRRLEQLVTCRVGHAELVPRQVIDFGRRGAASALRQTFARCIAARQEGLVLKPDDEPYFDFAAPASATDTSSPLPWPYLRSYAIKLKKEYVGAFGELGDFAVVGGRYDAVCAKSFADLPGVRWTHFYLGCLQSGPAAVRPCFVVTNVVTLSHPLMKMFLTHCRPRIVPVGSRKSRAHADGDALPFDLAPIEPGLDDSRGGPTDLFADLPVVDVRCFAFHRQGYGTFWSPRFPTVTKFHFDRTYRDALTFADLQTMAEDEARRQAAAETVVHEGDEDQDEEDDVAGWPTGGSDRDSDEEETAHWVAQLKQADPARRAGDETSQSTTSRSTTTRCTSDRTTSQASFSQPSEQHSEEHAEHTEAEQPTEGESSQSSLPSVIITAVVPVQKSRNAQAEDEDEDRSPTPRPLPPLALWPASKEPSTSPPARTPSPPPPSSSPMGSSQTNPSSPPTFASQPSQPSQLSQLSQGRKRLRAADIHFPAVSPPMLKRRRSQPESRPGSQTENQPESQSLSQPETRRSTDSPTPSPSAQRSRR